MLKKERQAFIMHELNVHNKVLSTDLSQRIQTSEDTIRRDLNELAESGKLIKVHGGALSKSFHDTFHNNDIYLAQEKKLIASKAVQLLTAGMTVLTTGGTTILEFARALPRELHATFITGSLPAAIEYMHHPNIEVIVIGDKLSKNSQITTGAKAIAAISEINADLCFLGTNAIDVQHGITDNDWDVSELKRAMIQNSKKVVSLCIADKLNTVQKIQVCDISKVHTLITELSPTATILDPYQLKGLEII
jgi:DeoR/GlpR family transcriptional regulator of sugar metabolism